MMTRILTTYPVLFSCDIVLVDPMHKWHNALRNTDYYSFKI